MQFNTQRGNILSKRWQLRGETLIAYVRNRPAFSLLVTHGPLRPRPIGAQFNEARKFRKNNCAWNLNLQFWKINTTQTDDIHVRVELGSGATIIIYQILCQTSSNRATQSIINQSKPVTPRRIKTPWLSCDATNTDIAQLSPKPQMSDRRSSTIWPCIEW